jgi:1,4-alpha-glucan branching enzyme
MNPQPPVQPVSARFPALEEQEIILTLFDPEAREVNVAGHFNGWHPIATPLKNMGAGKCDCAKVSQQRPNLWRMNGI